MHKSPIESLHSDREVIAEIRDQWHTRHVLPRSTEIPEDGMSVTEYLQPPLVPVESPYQTKEIITEAIILAHGRPSLLVQKGEIKLPETETWKNRLKPFQAQIEQRIIASVGRVELLGHPDFEWVGTAWAIADGVLVTNRHVAEAFAERQGRQFAFRRNFSGQPVGVRIDFREEYQRSEVHELEVEQILFVAESGHRHPDIAFLKLKNNNRLPSPLELADRDPKVETMIGILGYPARDSRSDGPEMARIFKDIFDVKRFAPGYVSYADDSAIFEHDCSTLGGNSGSVVISLKRAKPLAYILQGGFGSLIMLLKQAL